MLSLPAALRLAAVLLVGIVAERASAATNGSQTIQIYAIPSQVATSTAFTVAVRKHNSTCSGWRPVPLYQHNLREINATSGSAITHSSSMAYFDFDGAIDVSIQPNAAAFPSLDKVEVRPLSYGIQPAVQGGVINLTLSEPRNLVIQVNGDIFNVLHLFLNRIEDDPITAEQAANDSSIVYFAPGYHALNGGKGTVNVTSGQTVYFAQGAVVNGAINIQNVSDVSVRGRGLVYKTSNTLSAFLIESSHNVLIDGIVVLNPGYYSIMAGQVQGVTVRNFRSISATTYGDGIDFFCSKDVLVERVFMRNSDDCIALYQHRWNYYGDSGNITIRDSSLWADVAHPINIGTHGNADSPETMDGVMIANIDVLDHREPQVGYQGCVAISAGDENTIQNVLVDGVRVEDFRDGMLFNFRVNYNPSYNAAPGRAIRNVTVRNLSYQGTRANMPVVNGYSDDRRVEFVDFQNLTINGAHIWDGMKKPTWYLTGDTIPMFIGAHVNNFTFSS